MEPLLEFVEISHFYLIFYLFLFIIPLPLGCCIANKLFFSPDGAIIWPLNHRENKQITILNEGGMRSNKKLDKYRMKKIVVPSREGKIHSKMLVSAH